jgi:hypothetical protein
VVEVRNGEGCGTIDQLRVKCEIECSLSATESFISNVNNIKRETDIERIVLDQISEHHVVVYKAVKSKIPFFGDRDFVLEQVSFVEEDGSFCSLNWSVKNASFSEKNSYLLKRTRADCHLSGYRATSLENGRTEVLYFSSIDLKGLLGSALLSKTVAVTCARAELEALSSIGVIQNDREQTKDNFEGDGDKKPNALVLPLNSVRRTGKTPIFIRKNLANMKKKIERSEGKRMKEGHGLSAPPQVDGGIELSGKQMVGVVARREQGGARQARL